MGRALLLLAGANWLRFGDPLESGYGGEVRQFRAKYFAGNFMHLLFLPAQGVFVYAPVLIMGVAAWPAFFLRHRREALLALLDAPPERSVTDSMMSSTPMLDRNTNGMIAPTATMMTINTITIPSPLRAAAVTCGAPPGRLMTTWGDA